MAFALGISLLTAVVMDCSRRHGTRGDIREPSASQRTRREPFRAPHSTPAVAQMALTVVLLVGADCSAEVFQIADVNLDTDATRGILDAALPYEQGAEGTRRRVAFEELMVARRFGRNSTLAPPANFRSSGGRDGRSSSCRARRAAAHGGLSDPDEGSGNAASANLAWWMAIFRRDEHSRLSGRTFNTGDSQARHTPDQRVAREPSGQTRILSGRSFNTETWMATCDRTL